MLSWRFQSTLPMRGETMVACHRMRSYINFNPLSPCGERLYLVKEYYYDAKFQSTLPMRGETQSIDRKRQRSTFQSTLPMRGETSQFQVLHKICQISIHSPHAGRDEPVESTAEYYQLFQSTLPMRGETNQFQVLHKICQISIHSPHAGRDSCCKGNQG